jgi:trimethylamine--corrinoid protein Co-methyltransferase
MKTLREPLRFLDRAEMETLHRNALRILAEIGMKIDHDDALDALRGLGCKVDRNARHVLFPQAVTQKCVDKLQADFAARREPEQMSVRYSHVRFRRGEFGVHPDFSVNAGGYCVFIYDLDGVRRTATLQDTRNALKLVHQLDQITYTGLPVAAQDVPLAIRPVRMVAELVKHTDKYGGIEALNLFDIEYICRIGEIVRGGAEEFRRRPILVGYAEARTPLTIDRNMCEVMLEYLRRKLPQSLDTMPNAGATAPMNPAGALALGLAETLAGLVLAYAVDPDAIVTLDVTPSYADMRTGIFRYSGAERMPLLGARVQMISEFYGCPSGVHGGKTDATLPGARVGVEKAVSMLFPVLCGAVGFGTIGHIENAVTFSPLQLVIDNEIARYVRRAVRGFEVTDDAVNFDLIRRVGIGGNYLSEIETAQGFREFLNLSPFAAVEAYGIDVRGNQAARWEQMALERARQLMAADVPCPLTKEQARGVDEVVAEAEAKLREQGLL